jgi:hypothetical protein
MSEAAPTPLTVRLPAFGEKEVALLANRLHVQPLATLAVRLELSRVSQQQTYLSALLGCYASYLPNYLPRTNTGAFCEGAAHAHALLRADCPKIVISQGVCETRQETTAPDIDPEKAFIAAELLALQHSELTPAFAAIETRADARPWRVGFGLMLLLVEDTLEAEQLQYSFDHSR